MATPTSNSQPKINKISLHPNDVILDKYRIIEVIGHGGMNSDIYKAEDISNTTDEWFNSNGKFVAIKMVNRSSETTDGDWMKIHDECVTAKRASGCQNIVKTYDISEINNGNTVIIVMEYVNGVSLNNYLSKVGNINVKEALFIFEKILDAVKELHGFQHKIIHRDLKPENIMLTNDMTKVKLIDFGISSVLTTSKTTGDKTALTDESTVFGSFPYMCPETLDLANSRLTKEQKSKIISEQFDFFSLGVILYEMLVGQKPFSFEKE
ncbi:MAG: serine/threonine protein kinase, partial [Mycoplasmataceae bacterium]|nr:serine/threonine protein kinase [Mycoplasmataceae bacterium]